MSDRPQSSGPQREEIEQKFNEEFLKLYSRITACSARANSPLSSDALAELQREVAAIKAAYSELQFKCTRELLALSSALDQAYQQPLSRTLLHLVVGENTKLNVQLMDAALNDTFERAGPIKKTPTKKKGPAKR